MELHVLGADGGELLDYNSCGFLFDGQLLMDAGTVCSALPLKDILKIDDILISHTHLDHIKDLGLMADLLTEQRDTSVRIFGSATVIETLQDHYFNNKVWPDFTKIPHPNAPVMVLQEIQPLQEVKIGNFRVLPIPVAHTIETSGFLVSWDNGSLLYSSDTSATEELWQIANERKDLKAILLDVAFPNRLQWIADLSGHLTADGATKELEKLKRDVPVYFYHLKPAFHDEVKKDLKPLFEKGFRHLVSGEKLTFK